MGPVQKWNADHIRRIKALKRNRKSLHSKNSAEQNHSENLKTANPEHLKQIAIETKTDQLKTKSKIYIVALLSIGFLGIIFWWFIS